MPARDPLESLTYAQQRDAQAFAAVKARRKARGRRCGAQARHAAGPADAGLLSALRTQAQRAGVTPRPVYSRAQAQAEYRRLAAMPTVHDMRLGAGAIVSQLLDRRAGRMDERA